MKLTNNEIEDYSYKMALKFERINARAVKEMAKHIRDIGKLKPEDINRYEELARMRVNLFNVQNEITKQAEITYKQLADMYNKTANSLYKDTKSNYEYKHIEQVPIGKNTAIQSLLESIKRTTGEEFFNISQTTAKSLDYTNAIDGAILTVQSGVDNPTVAIRRTIQKQAKNGMMVEYPSGYRRNIFSSVRMNVLDGIRKLQNEQMRIMGKEFGADGIEIDAHGLCAEDHLPFQGRQFELDKFFDSNGKQIMDTGRNIGELNCQHGITYIILGKNKPVYSKEQLKQMKDYSNEKIKIGNNTMSRYQASQYMRSIENEMRKLKVQMQAGSSEILKNKLKKFRMLYNEVADLSGITPRLDRARI